MIIAVPVPDIISVKKHFPTSGYTAIFKYYLPARKLSPLCILYNLIITLPCLRLHHHRLQLPRYLPTMCIITRLRDPRLDIM